MPRRNVITVSDKEARKMVERAMNAGWLLWIKTNAWGNRKHLSKELLDEKFQEDANAVSAVVRLLDSDYVRAVTRWQGKAQTFARSVSVPWFHDGIYYVMEKDRQVVEEKVQHFKAEMEKALTELVNVYPSLIEQRIAEHPRLIKHEYFPDAETLRDRFRLYWGWQKVTLPMGDKEVKVVGADVVERENKKFIEMMKDQAEQAIAQWRTAFADVVTHLRDKLVNPNERFKQSTVEKPKELLRQFGELISLYDKPFADIASDIEAILDGVYAEDLRDDEQYRKEMGAVMDDVVKVFEDLPVVEMERAVEF